MTLGEEFVETLRAQTARVLTQQPDVVLPRLGRFVEKFEFGIR